MAQLEARGAHILQRRAHPEALASNSHLAAVEVERPQASGATGVSRSHLAGRGSCAPMFVVPRIQRYRHCPSSSADLTPDLPSVWTRVRYSVIPLLEANVKGTLDVCDNSVEETGWIF
ncbi:hypothetical protein LshimejAT787_0700640 [Lyophyllum shimeji]|uniref:Uncharacterized protein n=1 Tax=Lyophyllum shimeji TaxID=47721 RepID=A0A9P3PQ84_LYOSH|nr:hypothetical protein LshimejAT787_0700640 [Lyophyllum shimeji]